MADAGIANAAASYAASGFAVIRAFLPPDDVADVLRELDGVLAAKSRRKDGVRPPAFRALGDAAAFDALRRSAAGVDVFGAPGVVDTVGHGFHFLAPHESVVSRLATGRLVGEVARRVSGLADPRVAQTKFVMKPARAGVRVPVHADAQYIYTSPASGAALWIALDDADRDNGCVEVLPNSHREFRVGPRFAVGERGGPAVWREDAEACEKGPSGGGGGGARPFPRSKPEQDALPWVSVPARSGDCVVMHHGVLHRSAPNTSRASRRALTLHLVDGACAFSTANWIPEPDAGFPHVA